MPLSIVRLVLICKTMECLQNIKQIKQISVALYIKTSLTMGNGIWYPTQCTGRCVWKSKFQTNFSFRFFVVILSPAQITLPYEM